MVENPGELQKAKIPLVLKLLRESKAMFFFFLPGCKPVNFIAEDGNSIMGFYGDGLTFWS